MMHSKTEIITELEVLWKEVESLISEMQMSDFLARPIPDKWSVAEEFHHILKANVALTSALKHKALVIKHKFGTSNRALRSYEQVKDRYLERLEKAGKILAPQNLVASADEVFDKADMLNHWNATGLKLTERIHNWSDKNLDDLLLPHPLMGKVVVREFLYFTHYHTQHHLNSMKAKFAQLKGDSIDPNR